MNFRKENKLDFNIALLKEHRKASDCLCHRVLSLAMSPRCVSQDSFGTVTPLAMRDSCLLESKHEITGEDTIFFFLYRKKNISMKLLHVYFGAF